MKKFVIASLVLSILCIGIYTNTADAAAAKKPLKGQIVSLDDIIKAKTTLQLTKAQAKELLEAGSPLVFLYNKKVYFVKNEDGSFAFKKLADYAHNKYVGILGTTKTVKGINYIIMTNIESMD
jgi:hypothetical protein